MSDWNLKYRPATFRGVPFFVESHEFGTGRRPVQFVFPARDKPSTEDLGRAPQDFSIEGYLLGADYFDQRNKLIEAFEKAGPGILIHPYLGSKNVQVNTVRFRETNKEGRITTFSVNFMEAGDSAFPTFAVDKISKIASFASKILAVSQAAFAKVFIVTGFSQGVVDAANGRTLNAIDAFSASTQNVANLSSSLDDVNYGIRNLRRDSSFLAGQPTSLASRLTDSILGLTGVGLDDQTSLRVVSSMSTFGNDFALISKTTPSKTQISKNQDAIRDLVQQVAISQMSLLSIQIDWPSFEDAQTQREFLLDAIENQMETTTDDDVYQALDDLKGGLAQFLPDETEDLPRLREIVLPITLPSLVVVYNLFEAVEKEADLIARNHIAHPGYIPGGVSLEVLSD